MFQLNKFASGLARTDMKAKKIREKASGSNSIGISQTCKLLGMSNLASRRETLEKPPKCFGPHLERGVLYPSEACFCLEYTHGISPISLINLFPGPLGSRTALVLVQE